MALTWKRGGGGVHSTSCTFSTLWKLNRKMNKKLKRSSFIYLLNLSFHQLSIIIVNLILYRMGFFGAAHGWGAGQKGPHSLKSVTHILQ